MQAAIPVLILILVAVAVVAVVGAGARHLSRRRRVEVLGSPTETLRVLVPIGTDPAVYVAALRHSGYESLARMTPGGEEVVVNCHQAADRERERVRAVLAVAPTDLESEPAEEPRVVRFRDE